EEWRVVHGLLHERTVGTDHEILGAVLQSDSLDDCLAKRTSPTDTRGVVVEEVSYRALRIRNLVFVHVLGEAVNFGVVEMDRAGNVLGYRLGIGVVDPWIPASLQTTAEESEDRTGLLPVAQRLVGLKGIGALVDPVAGVVRGERLPVQRVDLGVGDDGQRVRA